MAIVAVGRNDGKNGTGFGGMPSWGSPDRPAPTIRAERRDRGSRAALGGSGNAVFNSQPEPGSSPYRVPTMAEVRAVPWNGYTAVSTFSGGGGSSLGYRMAGFRVRYAAEFIREAQATYRANAAAHTAVDPRDVRNVSGADILKAAGLAVGELDLFDGSPPCAPFSTMGKRHAGWGTAKRYSNTVQRSDDLFGEYIRLIGETQPRVFVAENVSGLVKGTAKGYFIEVIRGLKECGYQVAARLLDAQWLGVPQARQRLIFVGVRNDLNLPPAFPSPQPRCYTVRQAVAGLPTVTHDPETGKDLRLTAYRGTGLTARRFTLTEVRRLCGFPDDFVLTGTHEQRWERLGRAVPPVMMAHVAATIRDRVLDRIPT